MKPKITSILVKKFKMAPCVNTDLTDEVKKWTRVKSKTTIKTLYIFELAKEFTLHVTEIFQNCPMRPNLYILP